jgi:hypothetical protein
MRCQFVVIPSSAGEYSQIMLHSNATCLALAIEAISPDVGVQKHYLYTVTYCMAVRRRALNFKLPQSSGWRRYGRCG